MQNKKLKQDHEQFKRVLKEAAALRYKKLLCYGQTYNDFGLLGLTIKINDKNGRLKNVMQNSSLDSYIKDETLRDTVIDMLNYCAMWIMEHDTKHDIRKKR